jgi:D-alanyl-D-alanine carboxypeptidase
VAASTLALWGGGNAVAADQGVSQSDLRASLKAAVENYLASRGAIEHISAVSLRVTFAGERPSIPGGYFFDSSIPQLAPLQGRDLRRLNLSYAQGAGGIVSTLKDLAKWERALYEGRELPAKQQRELESLVSQKSGKPIKKTTHADPQGYGLGVGEATSSLGHFWFYEGETFGFRVLHIYIPRSGTLIDVAVNSSTENDDLSDLGLAAWVILRKAGTA